MATLAPASTTEAMDMVLPGLPYLSVHCRACQCARICWSSPSGVLPVSTSPALLIALHTLCSRTQKPWWPP
jgi:hypothetical protein